MIEGFGEDVVEWEDVVRSIKALAYCGLVGAVGECGSIAFSISEFVGARAWGALALPIYAKICTRYLSITNKIWIYAIMSIVASNISDMIRPLKALEYSFKFGFADETFSSHMQNHVKKENI